MPSKPIRVPNYRLHKPSGQARVIINGQHVYLGKFGSAESWEKYHRIVAERLAGSDVDTPLTGIRRPPSRMVSIDQIILAYWQFAQGYYQKNGHQTGEAYNVKVALRPLRRLYGSTPASNFGPDASKCCSVR